MKNQDGKKNESHGKSLNQSLTYLIEITDKEGRLLQRIEAPSRSYVEQWNRVINVQAKSTASTIKDTGGVSRSISPGGTNLLINSGAGVTAYGIRTGKGLTLVTITDYALETPLAEGTGIDQLTHLASTYTAPTVAGSDCSFTIRRTMINNTGATITGISEIGAYMRMGSYYGLAFRDVLASPASVPDGGGITVTYTIKVTA